MEPSGSRTAEEGGSEVSRDGRIALGGPAAGARAQSPVDRRIRRRARGGLRYGGPDLPGEAVLGGVRRYPTRGPSHRDPPSGLAARAGRGRVRYWFGSDSIQVQVWPNLIQIWAFSRFWFSFGPVHTYTTRCGRGTVRVC